MLTFPKSSLAKRVTLLLEAAVSLLLVTWALKTYLAQIVSDELTVKGLQLAVRLDPDNAENYRRLGLAFQYQLSDIDLNLAIQNLRKAAELNPHDPQNWLDFGTALKLRGDSAEAEACIRRADALAPNLPAYQWPIGNFFLMHGNIEESFHHFRFVLAGSSQYNRILFSRAWKGTDDGNKILNLLIPNDLATEFDYLNYLLSTQHFPEAQSVWSRTMSSPETFPPSNAAFYIDALIEAHRPREAYQVWTDLSNKGVIKALYQTTLHNLIVNGDFEEDPLNMGFDWRVRSLDDADAGLDETTYHSPGHSLLIDFSGKRNLDYRQVYQYVRVVPGRSYRLQGFIKTEEITTDSGPRLEVRDAYDGSALDKLTDGVTGSTTGWTELILDFVAGPKTELLVVGVTRLPSRKLNNMIAGRVWLDDFSLRPLTPENAPTRR